MMLINRFISVVGVGFVSFVTCAALPTELLAQQPAARQSDNRTAQTLDATAAAERVERALGNDPVLATFNLNASDQGIVIVLNGSVNEVSQKALAETLAKRTAPGFQIVNQVAVH